MKNINDNVPTTVTKEHLDRALEYYEKNKDNSPPPKAKEIVQYAAQQDIDARSKFGKELMEQISKFGVFPTRAHQYAPKNTIKLTEEQEEFIRNNACRIKWMDCARQIFPEVINMNPASVEARTVKSFYDALPENLKLSDDSASKNYSPPKTIERAITRVNKYILDGINKDKLTNSQKTNMLALIKYLHGHRFVNQANSYQSEDDRDAFEDCFVRYTYDKSDLTEEEIDQYIILSSEVVIAKNTKSIVDMLQETLRSAYDPNNEDGGAMTMKLVEAIKSAQTEYNQCITRQGKLVDNLKGRRSDRIKNKLETNKSFANVIEAWKEEETRLKMLKFAEMRRARMKEGFLKSFESMDDMTAEIFGLTEEEVLDG